MSAEPFDQEQPDDLWDNFDRTCAFCEEKQPVVVTGDEEWDPRPVDERTPDLGPMRVAAAAAFISAGVAVVGAWHGMLWLLDVAVS